MATRSERGPILNAEEILQLDCMLAAHRAQQMAERMAALERQEEMPANRLQAEILTQRVFRQTNRELRDQLMRTIREGGAAWARRPQPEEPTPRRNP